MMPGREYQAQPSRFGFNGKENDNDVKGFGNQQDYGMRIYDVRIGKFLSVDPLIQEFPFLTPYQFASNSPIANIDLDGKESLYFNVYSEELYNAKGKLIFSTNHTIRNKTAERNGTIKNSAETFRKKWVLGVVRTGTVFDFSLTTSRIDENGKISVKHNVFKLYFAGEGDKDKGGLYFVSEKGGYGHANGTLDDRDLKAIKIDLLVDAVGGYPKGNLDTEMSPFAYTGDEVHKLAKLLEVLKSDKDFMVKVEKVLSSVKAVLNAEKAGEKGGKAINEILKELTGQSKATGAPRTAHCNLCGFNLKDSANQWVNDPNGIANDTISGHSDPVNQTPSVKKKQ